MQLLWINMMSDVLPAIGLAMEPPEPDVLRQPPRDPNQPFLGPREFNRLGAEAGLMSAGALAVFGYGVLRHGRSARARALTCISLTIAQLLHALTSRSPDKGLFNPSPIAPNPWLKRALALSFAAQGGALLPPLRGLLGIGSLDLLDVVTMLAGGVLPYIGNEAMKIGRASSSDHQPRHRGRS
jgi:Ca2+-transporting ATPase